MPGTAVPNGSDTLPTLTCIYHWVGFTPSYIAIQVPLYLCLPLSLSVSTHLYECIPPTSSLLLPPYLPPSPVVDDVPPPFCPAVADSPVRLLACLKRARASGFFWRLDMSGTCRCVVHVLVVALLGSSKRCNARTQHARLAPTHTAVSYSSSIVRIKRKRKSNQRGGSVNYIPHR